MFGSPRPSNQDISCLEFVGYLVGVVLDFEEVGDVVGVGGKSEARLV